MRIRRYIGTVAIGLFCLTAAGAELGRQAVGGPGSTVTVERGVATRSALSRSGVEFAAGWTHLSGKLGDDDIDDDALRPCVTAFLGAGRVVDLGISLAFLTFDSGAGDVDDVAFGLGPRAWLDIQLDWAVYVDAAVVYHLLNVAGGSDEEGALGLGGGAGLGYRMNEWTTLRFGIAGETMVSDSEARVGDEIMKISVDRVGFEVAALMTF